MDLKIIRDKLVGNDQERAVSPVIGVILMVAITVILAAVIAAFVLDMSPGGNQAPQADFQWNDDGDTVTIEHRSGDNVDMTSVDLRVDHSSISTLDDSNVADEFGPGDTIYIWEDTTAGTLEASTDSSDVSSPSSADINEVTLVWEDGDGGSILDDYEK